MASTVRVDAGLSRGLTSQAGLSRIEKLLHYRPSPALVIEAAPQARHQLV